MRGRLAGGWAAVSAVALAFCLTLLPLPASAHDSLTDSSPAEGEVLTDVPAELHLTFSGEISDVGVQFMVTGPEGRDVVQGIPTVDGFEVRQALAEELIDGDYEAAWRVTSSDGHPISGTINFTIDAEAPATEAPATEAPTTGAPTTGTAGGPGSTDDSPATDNTPTSDGTATTDGAVTTGDTATTGDTGTTADDAEVTDDPAEADSPTASNGIPPWGWLVAAVAAVGLVACGFLAFRRN